MNDKRTAREGLPRVIEGQSVLTSNPGDRTAVPRVSTPTSSTSPVAKVAGAVTAALVLAFIGTRAGGASSAELTQTAIVAAPAAPPPAATAVAIASAAPPSDLAENAPRPDGGAEPAGAVLPDGRIVLNLATEEELVRLPGIGPSRARAIVALRQRLARFRAVEDLLRVKGIGRKTLQRIRPSVVLDRPLTAEHDRAPPTAVE